MLRDIGQSQKETYSMISLKYSIQSSQTLRNYKQNVFTRGRGDGKKQVVQWIELQPCNVKILWRSFAQQCVCG